MLNNKPEWKSLKDHKRSMERLHMRDLFRDDPTRFRRFSLKHSGLLLDYSKNRINDETMPLLMELAKSCNLEEQRDRMFSGDKINRSENRAVLHTALRMPKTESVIVDGEDVIPFIHETLDRMKDFSDTIRNGEWKTRNGKPVKTIVNIGIGGSDLGPKMVCKALPNLMDVGFSIRFVSNVDGAALSRTLKSCDPETTIFIIASKSFTTQETIMNAVSARKWFLDQTGDKQAIKQHFVALSANNSAAIEFGIAPENIFPFSDCIGGRYSLWSAIGLPICLALGFENFRSLLDGAYVMDRHFCEAPLENNMPVILAMLGIWYRNFWEAQNYAILPYSEDLSLFPDYLQQLDMESNGKNIDRDDNPVTYQTGPILFGSAGTNSQHSFFQLLHQGTGFVPCDFIAPVASPSPLKNHHEVLLANMIAQSGALMQGQTLEEADNNPQRVFKGNRPSNTIFTDRIDPFHLGMLIALYEHKIFVQGIIWNINSFDQWGVELGKIMAKGILQQIGNKQKNKETDSSSCGLLNHISQAHI